MAPPPEYDKEPKAPDKSATNNSCEEPKTLHNLMNDQQTNTDNKIANSTACGEGEVSWPLLPFIHLKTCGAIAIYSLTFISFYYFFW